MEFFTPKTSPFLKGAAVAEWLSSWLAEQEDRGSIPGLATWIFRDLLSPASKSRYGWKIAKSTLILKTTNQPTFFERIPPSRSKYFCASVNPLPHKQKKLTMFCDQKSFYSVLKFSNCYLEDLRQLSFSRFDKRWLPSFLWWALSWWWWPSSLTFVWVLAPCGGSTERRRWDLPPPNTTWGCGESVRL